MIIRGTMYKNYPHQISKEPFYRTRFIVSYSHKENTSDRNGGESDAGSQWFLRV